LNVQEQCVNLLKTAVVQKAVRNRGMKIHGWVFDVGTGRLIDLKIDFKKALKEITEIYDLGGMNIDSLTIDD
jgi:carbonic anhydrase